MRAKRLPPTDTAPHRILIVDGYPMLRYGVRQLIQQQQDLTVCSEARNVQDALAAVAKHQPALVLTDLSLPGGEGLELIKDLRELHPHTAVLVFSSHDEEVYAERALRAGARGYIMKNEGGDRLIKAIRHILRGQTYLSSRMSGRALEVFTRKRSSSNDSVAARLTDREFEVFRLLGQGLATREIGRRLRLSPKTVETHRLHVREKLHIRTGPALINFAVRWAGARG